MKKNANLKVSVILIENDAISSNDTINSDRFPIRIPTSHILIPNFQFTRRFLIFKIFEFFSASDFTISPNAA